MDLRLDSRAALTCHEYLHKKYAPNRFEGISYEEPKGLAEELARSGKIFELGVVEALKMQVPRFVNLKELDPALAPIMTAEYLMRDEFDVIAGAVIDEITELHIAKILKISDVRLTNRVSAPDLLVRVGAGFAWRPVEIKSHTATDGTAIKALSVTPLTATDPGVKLSPGKLRKEDASQLSHYVTHLREISMAPDDSWVGVIGRDGQSIHWQELHPAQANDQDALNSSIATYFRNFESALEVVATAMQRNLDSSIAAPAIPMVTPGKLGCKSCGYKKACDVEIRAFKGSGHVTLLPTVTPAKLAILDPPIDCIADLAECEPNNAFTAEAKIRAVAWQSNSVLPLRPNSLKRVPVFDVEIDIDLENAQGLLLELDVEDGQPPADYIFMYGWHVWNRKDSAEWESGTAGVFEDWNNSSDGELEVVLGMWDFLQEQVRIAESKNLSIGVFHHHNPETRAFRNVFKAHAGKPGVPSQEAVESFINEYMHDLYPLAQQWAMRSPSYSIKDLAPLADFEWRVKDPGGAKALVEVKTALGQGPDSETARTWLRDYNIDDCRSTAAFRDWLRKRLREDLHG